MQGATFEEFKTMIAENWEIEYTFGGHEYFYQRSWIGNAFEIYVDRDEEVMFHETGSDMDALAAKVLALRIYDGKTAEEAEEDISVEYVT